MNISNSQQDLLSLVSRMEQMERQQAVIKKHLLGIKRELDNLVDKFDNRSEVQMVESLQWEIADLQKLFFSANESVDSSIYQSGENTTLLLLETLDIIANPKKVKQKKFTDEDFNHANLENADLHQTNLYSTNLEKANLKKANLSGAKLTRTKLDGVNLNSSDLSEANLTNANFKDAKISGAILEKANLSGAIMPDGKIFESSECPTP
ncbi:pentapeptide repeat-containing protein [Brunnivagina elsteri]|uniref:Low-complexity protein n=1 Tax=Brunnivagina elsteri CCALA 953 TaxID=987040 RepID=A0A2A2TQJ0_9CYAN|nr:pentapeptide repeat-containing protein [Calothrix elsteri]PAX60710.1 hypothetical protein CK510_00420 [Calothrix elsteri CCALA 953]